MYSNISTIGNSINPTCNTHAQLLYIKGTYIYPIQIINHAGMLKLVFTKFYTDLTNKYNFTYSCFYEHIKLRMLILTDLTVDRFNISLLSWRRFDHGGRGAMKKKKKNSCRDAGTHAWRGKLTGTGQTVLLWRSGSCCADCNRCRDYISGCQTPLQWMGLTNYVIQGSLHNNCTLVLVVTLSKICYSNVGNINKIILKNVISRRRTLRWRYKNFLKTIF